MSKEINDLLKKIDSLDSNTNPNWGTMTAQKVVEHLINTFKIANGKLSVPLFSDEKKLPVLKKILMSNRPMPKGFDSPANHMIPQEYEYKNIDEAKEALRNEVNDYNKLFEDNPNATFVNPTFGELNKKEWEQFHKKHLTHHLTQFGLLD